VRHVGQGLTIDLFRMKHRRPGSASDHGLAAERIIAGSGPALRDRCVARLGSGR
jgi:hypothetical protein